MKADCIVVGGGIIGLLTAWELSQDGLEVMVLERGSIGGEASWAGGGVLTPLYPWRLPEALYPLLEWSQLRYPALAEELTTATGIDPEWTQSGLLILDLEERSQAQSWSERKGASLEQVEGMRLRTLEPGLDSPAAGALWLPDAAQIRNPRLLQSLRQMIELNGVQLREHSEVLSLRRHGDRLNGVETTGGRVSADYLVIAAGAWSNRLLNGLGLDLAVAPVRGQMILFQAETGIVRRILVSSDYYMIPRRDGHVLVGSTLENVGFDKSVTKRALQSLRDAAKNMLPAIVDYPIARHWAGLRPGSPGGIPSIGPHPKVQGLYVNTGHFRNGLALAPASARLMADLIRGRNPIVPPEPFALTAEPSSVNERRI